MPYMTINATIGAKKIMNNFWNSNKITTLKKRRLQRRNAVRYPVEPKNMCHRYDGVNFNEEHIKKI